MKIALISPKGGFFSSDIKFKKEWSELSNHSIHRDFWSGLSTGLLTIAALTTKSFKITVIDENFNPVDFTEKFDLVGITGMTQQATRAYEIADEFRKRKTKVVIGGIHATVMSEETKKHADSVVIGEAEELWPQFLNDFHNNNIKPFYRTSHLVDLTKSPIPRYDLVNRENYNVVWVQATRGCPRDCEFCAASKVYGLRFRHKNIQQVIDEIKFVLKLWGYGVLISFADDNMFIDKRYAVQLVEKLIPLKIRWFAQTDISVAEDEDFLRLLRKSGCSYLFIGFETLSKKGLKCIDRDNWKYRHFVDYKDAIKKIQSNGIGVVGAFILGLDTDTTSIFKKTTDFINNNHLYAVQLTILTPLPGTRLRERLESEKRVLSNGWDNYTFLRSNFIPKKMTPLQLEEGLMRTYKAFYNSRRNTERIKYFKEMYLNSMRKEDRT